MHGQPVQKQHIAAHSNVQLTSLDWPNVIPEMRAWQKRLDVDPQRVKYIEGNLFEVPFQGPYDLIVLSQIYHHFDPSKCRELTQKVANALVPGGRAVIHDFLADGLSNPGAVMFSVTMLNYLDWVTQTNGAAVASSTHSLPSKMPPSSTDVSASACRSMASAAR